jgi:hypothetical protein
VSALSRVEAADVASSLKREWRSTGRQNDYGRRWSMPHREPRQGTIVFKKVIFPRSGEQARTFRLHAQNPPSSAQH